MTDVIKKEKSTFARFWDKVKKYLKLTGKYIWKFLLIMLAVIIILMLIIFLL